MTYNKHALEVCHRRSCDIYNKQNSFHNINDDAGKVILLISSLFAVNELKLLNVSEIHTRTFTGQFLNLRRKNIFLTTWDDSGFIGRFVFTCRGTVMSIRRRKNHFNQNRFKYLCCCLKWLLPWCRCRTPAGNLVLWGIFSKQDLTDIWFPQLYKEFSLMIWSVIRFMFSWNDWHVSLWLHYPWFLAALCCMILVLCIKRAMRYLNHNWGERGIFIFPVLFGDSWCFPERWSCVELPTTSGGWSCGFSDMFVSAAFPQWSSLIASPPVTTPAAAHTHK